MMRLVWSRRGEVPLAAGPDGDGVIIVPAGGGRVGFNVALVDLTGVVLPLHDGIRFGEADLKIAGSKLEVVGYIGTVAGFALCPAAGTLRRVGEGYEALMDDGRSRSHGLIGGESGGQHLPVHVNQRQRFLGQMGRIGDNRSDGMTLVQSLLAGHDVAAVKAVVDRGAFFLVLDFCGRLGEVCGCNDGVDARQRQGATGVDATDAGVGVGAAQDFPVEHTRQVDVGGVTGAAHHLVGAVVAHRAGTHDAVVFFRVRQDDIRFVVQHERQSPYGCARKCNATGVIYHIRVSPAGTGVFCWIC